MRAPTDHILDPGWGFLLAGLAALAAAVLIPAQLDLVEAEHQRNRALVYEALHTERLERHQAFLNALDQGDPILLRALAASQLNLIPVGLQQLGDVPTAEPASVFAHLEPPPAAAPKRPRLDSRLARLATHRTTRLLLIVGGAIAVFIALLPPSRSA